MEDFYSDINAKDFAVVVPVFNSEQVLSALCQRIIATLTIHTFHFEVILVDDCSRDASWSVIQELKKQHPSIIKGIRLARNYGQHNATLCGFKHANAKIVITIDDDLEFQPEDISLLINKYNTEPCDVVYGVDASKKEGLFKRFFTSIFRKIQGITTKEYIRGSSFRLINGKIAKSITANSRHFSFIDEFLRWYTLSMTTVNITTQPSQVLSRYKVSRLMKITKNLVYISSSFPLKLVTRIGLIMMIFNFLAGLFIIYRRLFLKIDVKGYTTIIVTILFSFGILIFSLGIIAEYIGQILKVNYQKPAFNEREIL